MMLLDWVVYGVMGAFGTCVLVGVWWIWREGLTLNGPPPRHAPDWREIFIRHCLACAISNATPISNRAYRLTITKPGEEQGDWVRLEFAQELERLLVEALKALAEEQAK